MMFSNLFKESLFDNEKSRKRRAVKKYIKLSKKYQRARHEANQTHVSKYWSSERAPWAEHNAWVAERDSLLDEIWELIDSNGGVNALFSNYISELDDLYQRRVKHPSTKQVEIRKNKLGIEAWTYGMKEPQKWFTDEHIEIDRRIAEIYGTIKVLPREVLYFPANDDLHRINWDLTLGSKDFVEDPNVRYR